MTDISDASLKQEAVQDRKHLLFDNLKQKKNVMHAVVLRDIRSRAFNHGLGFFIVPFFPLCHMAVLLLFYSILGRESAFGEDLRLFFATGLAPTLLFMYVSRYMSVSLLANKSMMAFPVVRLLDIILARAFLEFIGIILAIVIMIIVLIATGSDVTPTNTTEVVLAMLATILFAIGLGIAASVVTAIFPFFAIVYSLTMIIFYISSGAFLYFHIFPVQLLEIASWNPIFHSVEWVRTGYYIGYPDDFLSKTYLLGSGVVSLTVGLLMERALRTYVLKN